MGLRPPIGSLERDRAYCAALAGEIWPKARAIHVGSRGRQIVSVVVDHVPMIVIGNMRGSSRAVVLALNSLLDEIRAREDAKRRRREAKARGAT